MKENIWYAITQSDKIKKGKIYYFSIAEKEIILWRDSYNNLHIHSKVCTHLGTCLSKGKILGDTIQCPFHGYIFDSDGQSSQKVPKLKKYISLEQYGLIWLYNGKKVEYELGDFISHMNTSIHFNDFYNISGYTKIYNLPTRLITANFFDLGHFKKVHGVEIQKSQILHDTGYFHYIFRGLYKPHYFFQKILFRVLPNIIETEILYKKNFIFSRHTLLTKKSKKVFEYFGFLPATFISKEQTQVVSNILIQKGFFGLLGKLFGKKILFKATDDEFLMLEGMNYNVQNFTSDDMLLKDFLEFYDNE